MYHLSGMIHTVLYCTVDPPGLPAASFPGIIFVEDTVGVRHRISIQQEGKSGG